MFIFRVLKQKKQHSKLTSEMKDKNKNVKFQRKDIKSSFAGSKMTLFGELAPMCNQ